MRKLGKHFSAVIGRILFIGFSVQILLGLAWMCSNFLHVQKFGGSFLFMASDAAFWEDFAPFLYLLQLGAAFGAGFFFLKTAAPAKRGQFFYVWGSLAMMTVPMSMQCHLAVLPDSLAGSLLLVQAAFLWKAVSEKDAWGVRKLTAACLCWFLLWLLKPEYLWLGAVLVLFLFFYGCRRGAEQNFRRARYQVLTLCAFTGLILSVGSLRDGGLYGKSGSENSFSAALFHRCAWTTVLREWGEWPEMLTEHAEADMLWAASLYSENVEDELIPYLEERMGRQETQALCLEAAGEALRTYPVQIAKEIIWDAFGYGVSPVGVPLFLGGRGYDSGTPRNYDIMRRETPILTRYYVNYSCRFFGLGLVLCICLAWLAAEADQGKKVSIRYAVLGTAAVCLCMVFWYTMRGAGLLDYKQTIAINSFWTAWMALCCRKALCAAAENEGQDAGEGAGEEAGHER